jgi:hypothetical protein
MMNDPEQIAMLLEIKEKADKAPKRGRPITKQQPNSQVETFDWMAPQFDPFKSSSQIPLVYTEEKDFISDDNDNEDITSQSIVPFLEDADRENSDKNLRCVIPHEGSTPSTSIGYQEGEEKSQTQSSSAKGKRTQSDFIYRPKKKSNSDVPLQATEEIRTSEADEPLALGFQSESETSSCVEDDPEEIVRKRAEASLSIDPETKFIKGNVQFVIKERNEFMDKKIYKANPNLRKKDIKERKFWHKELIQAWKNEIMEKDDRLIVPRAYFVLRKKLKRELKNHLSLAQAQAFRIAEDHAETEEEFEITFEYAQYQMRKHINDTIAEKH